MHAIQSKSFAATEVKGGGLPSNQEQCLCSSPTKPTLCDSTCTDLQTDSKNCGQCGVQCPTPGVCQSGQCKLQCSPEQILCDGKCVDPQSNGKHCGRCSHACKAGERCTQGACFPSCQASQTLCYGECVALQSHKKNCGACGMSCKAGELCSSGKCICQPGRTNCSGVCANLQANPNHCGGCGNACKQGQVCSSGKCQKDCPKGQTPCNQKCIDIRSDDKHCGACNNVCGQKQVCRQSTCVSLSTWAIALGSSSEDFVSAMHVDKNGNTTLAGNVVRPITLGSQTLKGTFVIRFNRTAQVIWAMSFGKGALQDVDRMHVDDNGNVTLAGTYRKALTIGSYSLPYKDTIYNSDVFVAQISKTGKVLWANKLGAYASNEGVYRMHVDKSGAVTLVGFFGGILEFGGREFRNKSFRTNVFIASFNKHGKLVWVNALLSPVQPVVTALYVDSAGVVTLAGAFWGSLFLGYRKILDQGCVFFIRLTKTGKLMWVTAFNSSYRASLGMEMAPNGEMTVFGEAFYSITIGTYVFSNKGKRDIFVARLNKNGKVLWANGFGSPGEDFVKTWDVDAKGAVTLAGEFSGQMKVGTKTLSGRGRYSNIYVMRLSNTGKVLWVKEFGSPNSDGQRAMRVGKNGEVTLFGYVRGTLTIETQAIPLKNGGKGGSNIYIVRLDNTGKLLWVRTFEGFTEYNMDRSRNNMMYLMNTGAVTFYGVFVGTMVAGTQTLSSKGGEDLFVMRLDNAGKVSWVRGFGSPLNDFLGFMRMGINGDVFLSGLFNGPMTLGTQAMPHKGGTDVYFVRFRP